jgi:hypothetical protein
MLQGLAFSPPVAGSPVIPRYRVCHVTISRSFAARFGHVANHKSPLSSRAIRVQAKGRPSAGAPGAMIKFSDASFYSSCVLEPLLSYTTSPVHHFVHLVPTPHRHHSASTPLRSAPLLVQPCRKPSSYTATAEEASLLHVLHVLQRKTLVSMYFVQCFLAGVLLCTRARLFC